MLLFHEGDELEGVCDMIAETGHSESILILNEIGVDRVSLSDNSVQLIHSWDPTAW